jgi:hypothetical protein
MKHPEEAGIKKETTRWSEDHASLRGVFLKCFCCATTRECFTYFAFEKATCRTSEARNVLQSWPDANLIDAP